MNQERPLPGILRQRSRALELGARLLDPPQLREQITTDARQEMVPLQRRIGRQRIHELESRGRTTGDGITRARAV